MDPKYVKMMEALVTDLLNKYMVALMETKDEYEYCTVVTAALVFKELALVEFKKGILRDSDDDPDDICTAMDKKAKDLAQGIRKRSSSTQQTLN